MERANELLKAINTYFSSDDGTSMRYYGTGAAAKVFADIFQTGELLLVMLLICSFAKMRKPLSLSTLNL